MACRRRFAQREISTTDAKPPEPEPASAASNREAFLKAEPTKSKLADQLDLSKPDSIPDHGFAGGIVIDATGLVLTNYTTHRRGLRRRFTCTSPAAKGSYAEHSLGAFRRAAISPCSNSSRPPRN